MYIFLDLLLINIHFDRNCELSFLINFSFTTNLLSLKQYPLTFDSKTLITHSQISNPLSPYPIYYISHNLLLVL